jgi:hypothetical protein
MEDLGWEFRIESDVVGVDGLFLVFSLAAGSSGSTGDKSGQDRRGG